MRPRLVLDADGLVIFINEYQFFFHFRVFEADRAAGQSDRRTNAAYYIEWGIDASTPDRGEQ